MKKPYSKHSGSSSPAPGAPPAWTEVRWGFGSFLVWEERRHLESFGQAIKLGSRSFDLLVHLLKRAGEVVSKDELLSAVWDTVVVDEASVRVHMSQLRKALGEPGESDECKEWISNIPLRGYRFNGRVLRELIDTSSAVTARPPTVLTKLPLRMNGLIGRENDVARVLQALDTHRLVTLVGAGGIGKTSAAIRVAERRQQSCATEIAFVDLAPLISPEHVLGAMARALGGAADLPDPVLAITQSLTGRNVLVLIDNCEQVVDSLALPITRLLSALPGLRILATSRETLRLSGEYVYRLPPLGVPESDHFLLAQAMQWPSVELLVELSQAAGAGAFMDSDGPLLAQISRQLEGVPLAIELVAARMGVQSVGDLALRLEDHMRLLSIDNRAAATRHQSLSAALDWSIALLSDDELKVFRRLSVFRGRFGLQPALGVIAGDMGQEVAFDALISLANKSLVFFDNSNASSPYRLLDTTRSYAGALLAQSDERPALLQRHAKVMLDLMNTATTELPDLSEQDWSERYAHYLDDVRVALEVCLTEPADGRTATMLVMASAALWFHVSQVAEFRDRIAAALQLIDRQPEPDTEMAAWLATELVIAMLHTNEPGGDLDAMCDRALTGALTAGVRVLELQARWGRCTHDMFSGEYSSALRDSRKLLAVAEAWSDPASLNLAHRVSGMANHFSGMLDVSIRHCEASLQMSAEAGRSRANMVGVDPTVAAKAVLTRTLWIRGETAKALETARDVVDRAESAGHAASLCAALYGACPVALWSGEYELASKWIHTMIDVARRKGLVRWLRYAESYLQGLQLAVSGNPDMQIRQVSERLATYDAPSKEMLATFCPDWIDDDMVGRLERGEGLWCAAEIWRGMGLRSERQEKISEAEGFYLRALETSRGQGARGWELRAATSLARLWAGGGMSQQALQLLDETSRSIGADGNPTGIVQVHELHGKIARGLPPRGGR
ncbi:winged helix-turn-helix domain-containing protein [Rhodanobacter sp. Root561]|uniref:ATP-binding protein n=1 Tax=Rhodanobacter sp. Root561 TaxID=1736560 RepID=UPI0009E9CDD4|nr:winged helix-turn-helix domain-containing protein [Rhodanobacter sp. Root561]